MMTFVANGNIHRLSPSEAQQLGDALNAGDAPPRPALGRVRIEADDSVWCGDVQVGLMHDAAHTLRGFVTQAEAPPIPAVDIKAEIAKAAAESEARMDDIVANAVAKALAAQAAAAAPKA